MHGSIKGLGRFLQRVARNAGRLLDLVRSDVSSYAHGMHTMQHDLQSIADAMPSRIAYLDCKFVFRFVNRAYAAHFDLEPEAVVGMHAEDLGGPAWFEATRPHLERAFRGERVVYERESVKDERKLYTLVHYIPNMVGARARGLYVMLIDITPFREAQRRLTDSEKFLEQAGAISGVGGFRIDLTSGAQTWTRQTFQMFDAEEGIAPSTEAFDRFLSAEMGARLWRAIRDAAETGVGYDLEMPVLTLRGRSIWVRTIGVVEFDHGKPARVVGAFQDITERKNADEALRGAGERLTLAVDAAEIGVWEWDLATQAMTWDEQMYRHFGRAADAPEAPLALWTLALHPDDRERIRGEIDAAMTDGGKLDAEFRIRLHGNGEVRHLKVTAQRRSDALGKPARLVGVALDVTQRKAAERSVLESEFRFRSLFELSPVGIALNDMHSGRFLHVNDALAAPSGYTREELLDMTYWDITPARYREDEEDKLRTLEDFSRYGPYEKEYVRKDGSTYPVLLSGIRIADVSGRPVIWSIVQDISERKAIESQLEDAAKRDKLTGLANRALFMERLESAVSRVQNGEQVRFAVLFLDFDRFKLINDTLGHDAGDELLRQISHRLRRDLRAADTRGADEGGNVVSRFGGDEFLVLINDLKGSADAGRIAERLLNTLAPAYDLDGTEVHSSASIGIITSDQCCSSAEEVVRNADVAMYEAKRAGRACSVMFNEAMHTRLARHVAIENCLRNAIGGSQLYLVYQPIVELSTGRMSSAEALVRWRHPTMGMVPPSEFIPIAEETNLIVALGQWVQREACAAMVAWRSQDPQRAPQTISVNVSRAELALGDQFVDQIRGLLARTGLPAHCLQLEVTEREVMRHPKEARAVLQELRGLGLRLAMDDFGTGTSSLALLRNYPFNTIKIDRSFVEDIAQSDVHAVIHATIDLVQNLGMLSLAEGVEEIAQLTVLRSLGCRYAQGYLFSPPVAADLLLDALASTAAARARAPAPAPVPGSTLAPESATPMP